MLDTLTAAKLSFVIGLATFTAVPVVSAAFDPPQPKPEASQKADGAQPVDQGAPAAVAKNFDRSSASKVDPATDVPPEMCFVPAGSPKIGLDKDQIIAMNLESANFLTYLVATYPAFNNRPLDAFYMDKFEVTNAQWKVYLDATGQKPSDQLVTGYWLEGKIPKGHEKRPVVYVSYAEVQQFAAWALKRIPTEFEWEYASRGTDGRLYPWGEKFDGDGKRGGTRANSGSSKGARAPVDVGSFPDGASPFGIQDLCGNVWEWTSSPFTAYDTKTISIDIPVKGAKPKVVTCASILTEKQNVIRGGDYQSNPIALLSCVRQGTEPGTWYNTIGFRCVRDAKPGAEVVHRAIEKLGARRFENSPIAWADVLSTEQVHYNDQGLINGSSYTVIAPADSIQREKTVGNLSVVDIMTRAAKNPVAIGLIATTEPILEPKLKPGNYTVALLAKDPKVAETQKKIVFPKSGWNYAGLAAEASTAKPVKPVAPVPPAKPKAEHPAKDDKKKPDDKKTGKADKTDKSGKGKDDEKAGDKPKDEPSKEPGGQEPPKADEPPPPPPEPVIELAQGAVAADRSHDALVLLDERFEIVAAMALDGAPKEVAATKGLAVDPLPANAPADSPSFIYRFRLGSAKNKTFEVVVPLRYRPLIKPATDTASDPGKDKDGGGSGAKK